MPGGESSNGNGQIVRLLRDHAFRDLFIEELGWDHFRHSVLITCRGTTYSLQGVAQKRSFAAYQCPLDRVELRDRWLLRDIQRSLRRYAYENVLIFTDHADTAQVWHWAVQGDARRPLLHREHPFRSHDPPAEFVSRLLSLRVNLEDEGRLSLVEVSRNVAASFNRAADQQLFFRNPRHLYESERLAAQLATGGTAAFHRFVEFHDGLARFMARRFEYSGVEVDDLEQMARIGLIRAAQRFEPQRGAAFSTYAFHWLRQTCQRYIPLHAFSGFLRADQFWRFLSLKRRAERRFGKGGQRAVNAWLRRAWEDDTKIGAYAASINRIWEKISHDEAPETRSAVLHVSSDELAPFDQVAKNDEAQVVRDAIAQLDSVDAMIIRNRYGIDCHVQTLSDVGAIIGVTRERVRQRQAKALEVLGRMLSRLLDQPLPALPPVVDNDDTEDIECDGPKGDVECVE